ncbi:hypothetical protein B0H14DRAFT_2614860 [Mycena olivaceomarginata]|nr:hypothetical protein B0H14DRAFT_2614860 [Mycena olivaceomarginata]
MAIMWFKERLSAYKYSVRYTAVNGCVGIGVGQFDFGGTGGLRGGFNSQNRTRTLNERGRHCGVRRNIQVANVSSKSKKGNTQIHMKRTMSTEGALNMVAIAPLEAKICGNCAASVGNNLAVLDVEPSNPGEWRTYKLSDAGDLSGWNSYELAPKGINQLRHTQTQTRRLAWTSYATLGDVAPLHATCTAVMSRRCDSHVFEASSEKEICQLRVALEKGKEKRGTRWTSRLGQWVRFDIGTPSSYTPENMDRKLVSTQFFGM